MKTVDLEGNNVWGFFQEESIAKLQHSYVMKTELFFFFIQKGKKRGGGEGNRWGGKEKHICHTIQVVEVFWEQICHLSIKHEAAWLCFHCTVVSTMITSPTTASLWTMQKWEGLPQCILMTDLWCNRGGGTAPNKNYSFHCSMEDSSCCQTETIREE